MKNLSDIQKLVMDIYNGRVEKYSVREGEDVVREAIVEACGGKFDFYSFQKNKWDVFTILTEVLQVRTGLSPENLYSGLVEVETIALGDTKVYEIKNNDLFKVSYVGAGNSDLTRQKIYGKKLNMQTKEMAVKAYAELKEFLTGKITLVEMTERVRRSFDAEVAKKINDAVYDAYTKDAYLKAPYKISGTTITEDALAELIDHVEASTGEKCSILGTRVALAKIPNQTPSDEAKKNRERLGHYGFFHDTDLIQIPRPHKPGTDEFATKDDFLLIVPNGEKIIKVVYEGDPIIVDLPTEARNDQQIEFMYSQRVGVAIAVASKYGYWKIA